MRTVKLKFSFVSPLLMDRMTDQTLENLRTGNRPQVQKDRPVKEVAVEKLYRETYADEQTGEKDGPIGLPIEMFFSAFANAGRNVKIGKKQVSTADSTMLPDFLSFRDIFVLLTFEGKPIDDKTWTVDKRRGRLKDGTAICVIRPKLPIGTEGVLTFDYDEKKIDGSVLRALVVNALSAQGLGSFRPNCKGPFGRSCIKTRELHGEEGWVVEGSTAENGASATPSEPDAVPVKKTRSRKSVSPELEPTERPEVASPSVDHDMVAAAH